LFGKIPRRLTDDLKVSNNGILRLPVFGKSLFVQVSQLRSDLVNGV
jgi:hypothetical protein